MKYIDADKLKAEIERRMTENYELAEKADEAFGQRAVEDNDILALIASLRQEQPEVDLEKETEESEKPINPDDAMEELNEKIALVKQRGTWDGVDVDKYMDEVRGREPEKPMSLEKEINRTYHDGSVTDTSDIDHVTYENIARHFYDLGCRRTAEMYNEIEYNRRRAEESVPNDLEEAAKEYVKDIPTFKDSCLMKAAFEDGWLSCKEQMLKEAVKGEVVIIEGKESSDWLGLSHSVWDKIVDLNWYGSPYKGEKIRIIIVKED